MAKDPSSNAMNNSMKEMMKMFSKAASSGALSMPKKEAKSNIDEIYRLPELCISCEDARLEIQF